MATLREMRCEACQSDSPRVTDAEMVEFQPQVPEWHIEEHGGVPHLTRLFTFPDFASALAFTNKVGALAEAEGHHPAILTEWGKVTVTWWTHAIHGLHRNDFILAARTDELYLAQGKTA